jgi:hypothetical protein
LAPWPGEGERIGRFERLAFCADAFLYPEAKIGGNEAVGRGLKPVIEPGARLAPDGDGVFKAGDSHKGNPRAFALQHAVGADGGAVAHVQLSLCIDAPEGIKHCLTGVRWS